MKFLQLVGLKGAVRGLGGFAGAKRAGLRRGLVYAAEELIAESIEETPWKTGTLRATWFIRVYGAGEGETHDQGEKTEENGPIPTEPGPGDIGVRVGYTAAYGIFVHERTELAHRSPGKAKFLTDPLERLRNRLIDIVAEEVRAG